MLVEQKPARRPRSGTAQDNLAELAGVWLSRHEDSIRPLGLKTKEWHGVLPVHTVDVDAVGEDLLHDVGPVMRCYGLEHSSPVYL